MRALIVIPVIICMVIPVLAQPPVRFVMLDIYADSGDTPLAAYQFELKATAGQVIIVGVENGEHPAFSEPPYYDLAALASERIIIAAFSTGDELPTGRTRIASVQLQVAGDAEPEYELDLTVAADADGNEIPTELSYQLGE